MSSAIGEVVGEGVNSDRRQDDGDQGRSTVVITVDGVSRNIHRGRQDVSTIKGLGAVPAAYELARVLPGKPLEPVSDDGSVVIKGDEEFVSYPKDSASSFVRPHR